MAESAVFRGGQGHPVRRMWLEPGTGIIARIRAHIARCGAHPARTVVLVPYAQLMPQARAMWLAAAAQEGGAAGFLPRFESSSNWADSLGAAEPRPGDFTGRAARDLPAAQARLEQQDGIGARAQALAPRLLEAAAELRPLAAAIAPQHRGAWARRCGDAIAAQDALPDLEIEHAVARTAIRWAGESTYSTDALHALQPGGDVDCLVVLRGLQADALADALLRQFGDRAAEIGLALPGAPAAIRLHAARDGEDEAQRTAACVLAHIEAGRAPVALVAGDLVLTRRVRALLESREVPLRDQNGWALSTTRAAAQVMAAFRACQAGASTDAVLDWAKNAPALDAPTIVRLERHLRRDGTRLWERVRAPGSEEDREGAGLVAALDEMRAGMASARGLLAWVAALRDVLQAGGVLPLLQGDAAGDRVLAALGMDEGAHAELAHALRDNAVARRRMALGEFIGWVQQVLEGERFVPPHAGGEPVAILPLSQLVGREFAAVVLPGCDERSLPASPDAPPAWSEAQRALLGLPDRAARAAQMRAAWDNAMRMPEVDVLWRGADARGEPLLQAIFVQELQLDGQPGPGVDAREMQAVEGRPTPKPAPRADRLPVTRIAATAYEALRSCPYRFFALHQLGLQEADELESEADKRDFGQWLHHLLRVFHEALRAAPTSDRAQRVAMLDEAAQEATRHLRLQEDEFLPFHAAWPQVRAGYLDWLASHEADEAVFDVAEEWLEKPLGPVTLVGRIDRIDRAGSRRVLLDYKSEAQKKTQGRTKAGHEDTQLAFYAALLGDEPVTTAYVNVGERGETKAFAQDDVAGLREVLVDRLRHDLERIAQGVALPALGDGVACEFCAARGLCRRDFWDGA